MADEAAASPYGVITVEVDREIQHLIPRFLENQRQNLASLRAALRSSDVPQMQRIGHSMKGAGGGYGFDAVTDIGARIEQHAKRQEVESIQVEIENFSRYLDRVQVVFVDVD